MPPRAKKRKVKDTEEELLLHEKLTEAFFKYLYEEDDEGDEIGMFSAEKEEARIKIEDMSKVVEAVGIEWDEAVKAILDREQMEIGTINMDAMKMIIVALKTVEGQKDDIEYLFKTFSDPQSNTITQESLTRSLKHLSIRESTDKIALLMAFGHEQSFLQLVSSEQTTGKPISSLADKTGLNFEEFRRTFIRSTFPIK